MVNTLLYAQFYAEMLSSKGRVCASSGLRRTNAKQMPIHLTWNVILQKLRRMCQLLMSIAGRHRASGFRPALDLPMRGTSVGFLKCVVEPLVHIAFPAQHADDRKTSNDGFSSNRLHR